MAPLISFRPATPADDGWLGGRLPADRARGVAFVGERFGLPVAAFAVAPPVERYVPEGLALAFSVEPALDAAAVAGEIVRLARRMATAAAVGPLHAWPPPVDGSPGDRAYRALGFASFDRIVAWQVDAVHAREALMPLVGAARAWAPDDAVWRAADLPLGDADADAVADLYESTLARLGPTRDAFVARLRGRGPRAFHPVRSRVLAQGGAPIAAILIEFDPAVSRVAARFAAAAYRDGIANVRLFASVNAAAPCPPGCQLRFETHDRHRGTAGLARRLKATAVETRVKLRLDASR